MNVHPEEVVRALFNKGKGVDTNNIPSQHICPLKQEPPIIGLWYPLTHAIARDLVVECEV